MVSDESRAEYDRGQSEKRNHQYTANSRIEAAALAFGVWLLGDGLTLRESWNAVTERGNDAE